MEKPSLAKGPLDKKGAEQSEHEYASFLCSYAESGEDSRISALVEKEKLSVNVSLSNRKTPLYFAVMFRNISTIALLLKLGADKNTIYVLPEINERLGWPEYAEVKLALDGHINSSCQQSLNEIIATNNPAMLAHLLENPGVKVDFGSMDVVTKEVLQAPYGLRLVTKEELASVTTLKNVFDLLSPQYIASKACYEDERSYNARLSDEYIHNVYAMLKLLFKANPALICPEHDRNRGWSPLHLAVELNHPKTIAFLIDQKADRNAQDDQGCTPLYRALEGGYLAAANVLLLYGADRTIQPDPRKPRQGDPLPFIQALLQNIDVTLLSEYEEVYQWYQDIYGPERVLPSLPQASGSQRRIERRQRGNAQSSLQNGATPGRNSVKALSQQTSIATTEDHEWLN
jgi:ankyrin repeat protein